MSDRKQEKAAIGVEALRGVAELISRRQYSDAVSTASQLRKQDPQNHQLNYLLACALGAQKDTQAALELFRLALAKQPDNAAYLASYGLALLEFESLAEAESVLEKAFRIDAKLFYPHVILGNFYSRIDRLDKAEPHFTKALALAPLAAQAAIRNSWFDARIKCGEIDAVATELTALVRQERATPWHLSRLFRIKRLTTTSDEYVYLRKLLSGGLRPDEENWLLHAKAAAQDHTRQFSEAFDTLAVAKSRLPAGFSLSRFDASVSGVVEHIDARLVERLSERYGNPSFEPIFVVGQPRSGTTLTEQILSSHPDIGGAGELGSFLRGLLKETSTLDHPELLEARLNELGDDKIRAIRESIRSTLTFLCPGKRHVIDKTPMNFAALHVILMLFPAAKFIHCYRNPCDNFMSAYKTHMTAQHSYSYSPGQYAEYYLLYIKLMRHWHAQFAGRIRSLRYESLVSNPEREIRGLLDFIGVAWSENCLRPEQNTSRVATPSLAQVRSPINAASVGRWRDYGDRLQVIVDRLGGELMEDSFRAVRSKPGT